MMYYQQGDVLIKRTCGVRGKKLNHLTLAEGEATGHHHTVTKGDAELYEEKGILYLKVISDEAELTHQEHQMVTLPKGVYEVDIVREYDHFIEETRKHKD
ncbi:MAG: hypothetical protein WCV56_07425 [Candidatus Omnitrophota bacterium]